MSILRVLKRLAAVSRTRIIVNLLRQRGIELQGLPSRATVQAASSACTGSSIFRKAQSSPSSRRVKHFADPPPLRNSSSRVSQGVNPLLRNWRCNSGQPVPVITVLPTTTALHANRRASRADADEIWDRLAQYSPAITVERQGIVNGYVGTQRTKAGVQMVVTRLDQFQRHHAAAEHFAELLVDPNVAANAVTAKEGIATRQGIAGTLETRLDFQIIDAKPMLREPLPETGSAALAVSKTDRITTSPQISPALAVNTRSGKPRRLQA